MSFDRFKAFHPAEPVSLGSHASGAQASLFRSATVEQAAPADLADLGFLERAGVPAQTIALARAEARRIGVDPGAALLATRRVGEDEFYRALARRCGLAFVTRGARVDPAVDRRRAAEEGVAPLVRRPGGPRWLVAPRGARGAALDPSSMVMTSPRRFDAFLRDADPARLADDAARTVEATALPFSARAIDARRAWPAVGCGIAAAVFALWLDAGLARAAVDVALGLVFVAALCLRTAALTASFDAAPAARDLPEAALPIYTVIVALYREAGVVDRLIEALERLDYPRAKLDVKLVVEADDRDTLGALVRAIPGVEYDVIVAPDGQPRTKPRALDVALPFARGELVTVYDAEDDPDPRQLRAAAARFAASPRLACLQAALVIDNAQDGVAQTLYALDYAALYRVFNAGLATLGAPMFLGGSSNHFRRRALEAAGGWDAWNVTEDADLGLRLARLGLEVGALASATREEAPVTMAGLLRQRVRWMKGWMQTLGVHADDPARLWRDLGPTRFAAVLATFASGVVGPMVWPLFGALVAHDAWFGDLLAPSGAAAAVRSTLVVWIAGHGAVVMIATLILGALREGFSRKLWALPLIPLWHLALFVAAWKALAELVRRPFYWDKTDHGGGRRAARPPDPAVACPAVT